MVVFIFTLTLVVPGLSGGDALREKETPDLCQGRVPDGGNYCGPVAVSNGLVWLSKSGYPQLFDKGDDPDKAQIRLAAKLASKDYMDAGGGAGVRSMANGVAVYLREKGVSDYTISYEGWRAVSRNTKRLSKIPSIDTVRRTLARRTAAVFLNLGRYKKSGDDFIRDGGHWITIVGELDGKLTAVDPAGRNGKEKKVHKLRLVEISGPGSLKGKTSGLPVPAKGYRVIKNREMAKSDDEVTIVDGIVYLRLGQE